MLTNNADGTFGGQANAKRDLLLTGAYESKLQYVPSIRLQLQSLRRGGNPGTVIIPPPPWTPHL